MIRVASLIPMWVLIAGVAASTYTPCDDCTDKASTSDLAGISFRLYTSDVDVYASALVADASSLFDLMNISRPTVIYVSGWTEYPESTSVQTVLQAYVTRDEHNILIVDFHTIAANTWDYVVESSNGVGYTIALALNDLVASGLDASTMHVVGHSLGGQIVGFIGRYVNFTLPRITGLDPAGPSFSMTDDHLCSTDAVFVDVIHTDGDSFGTDYSDATVDFWPNGDTGIQPGCENDDLETANADSHYRSWKYYAESVLDEDAFLAIACDSFTAFEEGTCGSDSETIMGYATPTTASGNYYLQTNSASPYGKGTDGVTYAA